MLARRPHSLRMGARYLLGSSRNSPLLYRQLVRSRRSSTIVSVDRSGLRRGPELARDSEPSSSSSRASSPLDAILVERANFRGPLSMAEFMNMALQHPEHGYYMQRDVFGSAGDFVTSPEISQVFGELVGVWLAHSWLSIDSPRDARFVEIGPGRGTLIADVLRVLDQVADTAESELRVDLVETSPALREIQRRTLLQHATPAASRATGRGDTLSTGSGAEGASKPTLDLVLRSGRKATVTWHERFDDVPSAPTFFVAQELFDALPVHHFTRGRTVWEETLIAAQGGELAFVRAPSATPASALLSAYPGGALPEKIGAMVEISPSSWGLMETIARRVGQHGGAGLVIDYGKDGPAEDSVRAIRRHAPAPLLREVGTSDISAHVDFAALRGAALGVRDSVWVPELLDQRAFLQRMGIDVRRDALIAAADREEQRARIRSGCERLTGDGPDNLGRSFRVLALCSHAMQEVAAFEARPN